MQTKGTDKPVIYNPKWASGASIIAKPATPSEFEIEVERLGLTPDWYPTSIELRMWCEHNCNRCYVPEWLLEEWDIEVNADLAPNRR